MQSDLIFAFRALGKDIAVELHLFKISKHGLSILIDS